MCGSSLLLQLFCKSVSNYCINLYQNNKLTLSPIKSLPWHDAREGLNTVHWKLYESYQGKLHFIFFLSKLHPTSRPFNERREKDAIKKFIYIPYATEFNVNEKIKLLSFPTSKMTTQTMNRIQHWKDYLLFFCCHQGNGQPHPERF